MRREEREREREREDEAALRLQETKNHLLLLELEENKRQRLTEATTQKTKLKEDVSEVSEILVDHDLASMEHRDQDRFSSWVHNTSKAYHNAHVTTAELKTFSDNIPNLSVAGTSLFNQS